MSHTVEDKRRLLERVRRIRGQAEALERAIDAERGCAEVLHQIAGIRGAVQGLMTLVLEGHIREHVAGSTNSAQRQQGAEELVTALRSYLK